MDKPNETIEEMLARFEREDREYEEKLEMIRNKPEYDGETPTLTKDEELEYCRQHAIRTKEDILAKILDIKEYYKRDAEARGIPLEPLLALLDRFEREISERKFMSIDQDWWQYGITVRETGITLFLEYAKFYYDHGEDIFEKNQPHLCGEQQMALHSTKAMLITPEQFGALHGVSDATVRQWIRRGKVRSVSKYGKEWRIPETSEIREGHYSDGDYMWEEDLPCIPEEFEYLKDYDSLSISSVRGERGKWNVSLRKWGYKSPANEEDDDSTDIVMDTKQKERLELYLLSEPLVQCAGNFYGDFHIKDSELRQEPYAEMEARLEKEEKERKELMRKYGSKEVKPNE